MRPTAAAKRLGAARVRVPGGIFAAVPYCIDLIGGPYLETDEAVCKVFRPKSAVRDMGKALGYAMGQLDAWSKQVDGWGPLSATVSPLTPSLVEGFG